MVCIHVPLQFASFLLFFFNVFSFHGLSVFGSSSHSVHLFVLCALSGSMAPGRWTSAKFMTIWPEQSVELHRRHLAIFWACYRLERLWTSTSSPTYATTTVPSHPRPSSPYSCTHAQHALLLVCLDDFSCGVPIHMVLNPEPHLRPMVTPPSTPAIPGNPRSKRHGTTIFVERLPNRSSSSMMTSLACPCDWTPSARFGHHWLQWSTSCRRRTLQSRSPGMFRSTLTSWIFDGTIARVTLSACATPTCHILHTHRPQCRQQDTGTLFPPRPFTDFNQPYIMLHLAIEPFPLGTYHKMLDRRKIPSIHVVLQFPFYFFLLPCCCLVCIHLIPISALFSSEIWQSETPQPPI